MGLNLCTRQIGELHPKKYIWYNTLQIIDFKIRYKYTYKNVVVNKEQVRTRYALNAKRMLLNFDFFKAFDNKESNSKVEKKRPVSLK